MSDFGFTYAGTHSSNFGVKVVDIERYPLPTLSRQTVDVPSVDGVVNVGTSVQEKTIVVTIKVEGAKNLTEYADRLNMISEWLKPAAYDQELIFDDQPDVTWYASVSAFDAYTRALYKGQTKITFSCADPKGYKPKQTYHVWADHVTTDDAANDDQSLVKIADDGASLIMQANSQAANFPIYHIFANEDIYNIVIDSHTEGDSVASDGTGFVAIGQSAVEQDGVNKEPYIVNDPCNTLAPWTVKKDGDTLTFDLGKNRKLGAGAALQSYPNTISLPWRSFKDGYNNETINMLNYGDNAAKVWHGPGMLYTPFTSACKDFEVAVRVSFEQNFGLARSQFECILLGADGHEIARMGLKDGDNTEGASPFCMLGQNQGTHRWFPAAKISTKKGKKTTKTYRVYTGKDQKKSTKTVKVKGKKKTTITWKSLKVDTDSTTNTYSRFYGTLTLRKVGKLWTFTIDKIKSNGTSSRIYKATINDANGDYSGVLLQNAFMYWSKWDNALDTAQPRKKYADNRPRLCDFKVKQIIDGGNTETTAPTVIAEIGDEIVIDTEAGKVYKNGKPFEKYVSTSSDVSGLALDGANPQRLIVSPNFATTPNNWTIEHRDTVI